LVRKRLWLVPLGVILGQLLYIISFLPLGPLFALGIIYLIGCSVISLIGVYVSTFIRNRLEDLGDQSGNST
jgi:hypothetical protein